MDRKLYVRPRKVLKRRADALLLLSKCQEQAKDHYLFICSLGGIFKCLLKMFSKKIPEYFVNSLSVSLFLTEH